MVRASTRDKRTVAVMVTPNWKKNFPMIPFIKATGKKIATMAKVAAKAAKEISRAPTMAASIRGRPSSWWPENILQNHDGVIDHDPDRKTQTQKSESIERKTHKIKNDKGAHDRGRNRQDDVEGGG